MTSWLWDALVAFHVLVFGYFVVYHTYHLLVSLCAFRVLRRYAQRMSSIDTEDLIGRIGAPPVTLIVPAYNEAKTLIEASRSFLSLQYPEYEVIIVNDGSTDATLEVLKDTYNLAPAPRYPTAELPTTEVRGVYQSQTHPKLWVIDKENGGRADATNAGINYCRTPLLCITDADSLIERDALIRLVRPFLEDETTVASGGIVRIVNGCTVEDGTVQEVRLPRRLIGQFQVLEYLRSFLAGRVGWDALGIMFLVSGASGMFRRDLIVEIGGYEAESVGEDMELTVRIHRYCRERDRPYRVTFVPDPVVWTEAPSTWSVLGRQRDRWQRGLMDTMHRHIAMLFNPRYGRIGWVAYPYFFFLEMTGAVLEFIGYLVFIGLAMAGVISLPFAFVYFLIAVALGAVFSIISVGLEELSFRRYARFGDLLRLFGLALLEGFLYRPLLTYYRFKGTVAYFQGNTEWGMMERVGFQASSST